MFVFSKVSWYRIWCSFGTVAQDGLSWSVGSSNQSREVVGIVGASADIWIVCIDPGLDCGRVSELSEEIVDCSNDVPSILESWGEHASEGIDAVNLISCESWSHCHDCEFNHELSIRWDFSEKSLPSSVSHCYGFSWAWGNDTW